MADPFALTTPDPRFSPTEPVTVNGYLYLPAETVRRIMEPVVREMERQERFEAECG